jgi:hypothetical protein
MTDFAEVKLDEKANNAMFYHQTLVDGSNALKLQPIPAFQPLIVGPDLKPKDYDSKRAELVDRVHLAAAQLSGHYDLVADSDPKFIPYWDQETTFESALKGMPQIQRKKFFESYQRFFERNGIEERIELDKRLQHFSPFYSRDQKPLTYDRLDEKFRFFSDNRLPGTILSGLLFALEFVVGFNLSVLSEASTSNTVGGILAYSAALGVPLLFGRADNRDHRRELDVIAHVKPTIRAREADRIISAIKEFAD